MIKTLVQYGAGNIGRSLVGGLFSRAGWEVVFVDVIPEVLESLDRERRYRIVVKEKEESEIWVEGVRAVDGRDREAVAREISSCDLLSTAVGPAILPKIAPEIAAGIARRTEPLNILLCENLRGAPEIMAEALAKELPDGFPLSEKVGLIATSIGKMVPLMPVEVRKRDPLEVWAEAYNKLIADREAFLGSIPEVEGLVARGSFEAYVDQKLFVHNMGHAAAAYLGDRFGAVTIAQAMEMSQVGPVVGSAMRESGRALVRLYPWEFTPAAMEDYVEDLCRRFGNHALGDTVYRVGRDRPRKYAPNDRLIGALRDQAGAGVGSEDTLQAVAAGLFFSATDEEGNRLPADIEFERLFREKGLRGLLREVSGLNPRSDEALLEKIEHAAARWG